MKNKLHIVFLWAICLGWILFSSCGKLYWYRTKVNADRVSEKLTFKLVINNRAPEYLSEQFENNIRGICVHALIKKGFVEAKKDTPDYLFIVYVKVDSFEIKTPIHFRNGYTSSYKLTNPNPVATYTSFSRYHSAKEISFDYNLVYTKYNLSHWTSKSEFYFFGNEMRD